MYKTFELKWIYLPPLLLGWKILLIFPPVFLEKDSLSQAAGIAAVQIAYALFLFVTKPSTLPLVDFMMKLGAVHVLLVLGCLTINVRQQYKQGQQLDSAMVGITFAYVAVCTLCTIYNSVLPAIRDMYQMKRITNLMETLGMQYSSSTSLYVVPAEQRDCNGKFTRTRIEDLPSAKQWQAFEKTLPTQLPQPTKDAAPTRAAATIAAAAASPLAGAAVLTPSIQVFIENCGSSVFVPFDPRQPPTAAAFAKSVQSAIVQRLCDIDPHNNHVYSSTIFSLQLCVNGQEIETLLDDDMEIAWLSEVMLQQCLHWDYANESVMIVAGAEIPFEQAVKHFEDDNSRDDEDDDIVVLPPQDPASKYLRGDEEEDEDGGIDNDDADFDYSAFEQLMDEQDLAAVQEPEFINVLIQMRDQSWATTIRLPSGDRTSAASEAFAHQVRAAVLRHLTAIGESALALYDCAFYLQRARNTSVGEEAVDLDDERVARRIRSVATCSAGAYSAAITVEFSADGW